MGEGLAGSRAAQPSIPFASNKLKFQLPTETRRELYPDSSREEMAASVPLAQIEMRDRMISAVIDSGPSSPQGSNGPAGLCGFPGCDG